MSNKRGAPTAVTESTHVEKSAAETNHSDTHDPIIKQNREKFKFLTDFIPEGRNFAITGAEIGKISGLGSARNVNMAIHDSRVAGVFICNAMEHPFGYFLPDRVEDIIHFVRQMNSRSREIKEAARPAEEYISGIGGNQITGQISIEE